MIQLQVKQVSTRQTNTTGETPHLSAGTVRWKKCTTEQGTQRRPLQELRGSCDWSDCWPVYKEPPIQAGMKERGLHIMTHLFVYIFENFFLFGQYFQ